MRRDKGEKLKSRRRQPRRKERGVALITTLLLLMLLTGLSLAMVLSVRSDMLINGYYRNFRGSFYAADSGLKAARTAMVNGVVAAIPPSFGLHSSRYPQALTPQSRPASTTRMASRLRNIRARDRLRDRGPAVTK